MLSLLCAAALVVGAVDDEPGPSGLKLGASLDGGVIGNDVVLGASVSLGVESEPFALHLKAPVFLRVVDVEPTVDRGLPSFCSWLRCEDFVHSGTTGENVDATAIARVLDELRVFHPGDTFYLRGGQLTASLGSGAVVDRFTTAASWDRRTSGAYAALHLPWKHLGVEAVTGDVVSPGEFVGVRAEASPVDDSGFFVGVDSGLDVGAAVSVVDRHGEVRDGDKTRLLSSTSLSAGWLFAGSTFSFAPRLEGGLLSGLSRDGGDEGEIGVSAGAGFDAGVDVGVVDARLKLTGAWGTQGYRRGLFSTLYLVERRAALVGASVDGGSIVRVAAPGGAAVDGRLDASIFDVVAPVLRLHLEDAPGANAAEVGFIVDVKDEVSVSASVVRRGFTDVAGVVGPDLAAAPVVGAFELSLRLYGPLTLSVRWLRLPRFDGRLRVDDDIVVSLAGATVLTPR